MASRIKGITVEIGGDTTKLTDALRDVNNEVYNTQAQLKDVEKLLKLDPSNTELLAQKQRILNEEVQATKDKLEALKEAGERANEALKAETITKDQYDALQREIFETQRALEGLETQAAQSAVALQKISVTGMKFQEAGGKIEGIGKERFMSARTRDVIVRSLKTFAQAFLGVFIPALIIYLQGGWPASWAAFWTWLAPVLAAALAAAIAAVWNGIGLPKGDTMPTSDELEEILQIQMEPEYYDVNDADQSIIGADGRGER